MESTQRMLAFWHLAMGYVAERKVGDYADDVVSEMMLYYLQHCDGYVSLRFAFLHALDVLSPRQRVRGVYQRRSSWEFPTASGVLPELAGRDAFAAWADQYDAAQWHARASAVLSPRKRALVDALRQGDTRTEAAARLGCTQAAVTKALDVITVVYHNVEEQVNHE